MERIHQVRRQNERAGLQEQINALKAEIADLRTQMWLGPPRLGPQPQTQKEVDAQVKAIADRLIAEMKEASDG